MHKSIFSFLVIACACLLCIGMVHAQTFPVQVTAQLTPPYSLTLSDYASSSTDRFACQIFADIARPELQVKFRLTIEGQNVIMKTRPEFNPPPITIQGGIPERFTGYDLAAYFDPANLIFQGITPQQFKRTGMLPEGLYRFQLEVIEYNRGIKVSNTGTATAWLILNDPPIVNLPRQKEKIKAQSPQNVVLQWTPRHTGSPNSAFNTEYDVKMVEVWPDSRNPNDAILTSPPIFETTTSNTTIIYGPSETPLEPGRRYAFTVRAKSIAGVDELNLFKNNGYSEVFTFVYGDACDLPTGIKAETLSSGRVAIGWESLFNHTAYRVRYRLAGDTKASWYENNTAFTETELNSLNPNTRYEYQVAASCGAFMSAYSPAAFVTTHPAPETSYSCGLPAGTFELDPSQLIPSLKVGDVIQAGDFDVKLASVSGSNGTFSGEGVIEVPYFNKAKVKASFTSISVNKDLRMVAGQMNVTGAGVDVIPQGVMDAMAGLSEVLDQVDSALADIEANLPQPFDPNSFVADTLIKVTAGINSVYKDADGSVVITDNNGNQQRIPAGTSAAVTDDSGNGYLVESNGTIHKTDAVTANKVGNREYNLLLTFTAAENTKYGFDSNKNSAITTQYKKIENSYEVAWKSVAAGQTDVVKATMPGSDINANEIHFSAGGQTVAASSQSANTHVVTLSAKTDGVEEDVLALYTPADTSKQEQVLGQLSVVSYNEIQKNLIVVPVNGNTYSGSVSSLSESLNKIYSQAVVRWNVSMAEGITVANINPFDDGESGLLTNYTPDMKEVVNAYKDNMEDDSYYIFLVSNPKSGSLLGYMPRSKHAGFVFVDKHNSEAALVHTIAHELAHGAFNLQHTFSEEHFTLNKGTTDNLMDYTNNLSTRLYKYQWDKIRYPDIVVGMFEEDSDSKYETDGHYSTVYLVSLLLGMDPALAQKLAAAAEAPDTYVHSEYEFEINDTWSDPVEQINTHSLTYGYHGSEEFFTALAFLNTPIGDVNALGKLLHRYGDTYAHSRLDNLSPEEWDQINEYETITWFTDPWMDDINQGIKEFGLSFLKNEELQKGKLSGKTLINYLNDNFLVTNSDYFKMYGKRAWIPIISLEHMHPDGSAPDFIYVRPKWYLRYVNNLAKLISTKYSLPLQNFNDVLFNRMVNFAVAEQCTLKGVIDYEISKKLNKNYFFIPVFYSRQPIASLDAVFNTDYIQLAEDIKRNTLKYMYVTYGIAESSLKIEEVKRPWYNPIFNMKGISYLYSYKITIK